MGVVDNGYFEIRYRFVPMDGTEGELRFTVRLHGERLEHTPPQVAQPPAWARLDMCQCAHCPLDPTKHAHCPVALSVAEVVEASNSLLSFSEVEAIVETPERTFSKRTSMQRALSSLLGLYMATSGCPNLDLLKPMARFHLPFATKEETVYRAASTYLLGQYFLRLRGEDGDLDCAGLHAAYERLHEVNMGMAQRLRSIAHGDANINAIVLLDLFAHAMPSAIDLKLKSLEYLFAPYFRESAPASGQPLPGKH